MPYIESIVTAGKVEEIEKYHALKFQSPKRPRRENAGKSSPKIAKNNERNSEKKLRMLINANFKENDLYLTLTYKDKVPDPPEAKKNISKFIRKLRGLYKKHKAVLKYIITTEHKGRRLHHHLLINRIVQIGKREVSKLWEFGFSKLELFGGEPDDCQRLASYFVKESKNTFNSSEVEDRVHGLRWLASKNLIHPVPDKKIVPASTWREEPKARKGYYLDLGSIRRGYTQDGYPYLFYRLIKLPEEEG